MLLSFRALNGGGNQILIRCKPKPRIDQLNTVHFPEAYDVKINVGFLPFQTKSNPITEDGFVNPFQRSIGHQAAWGVGEAEVLITAGVWIPQTSDID
jgi:hypothetical protein